MTSDSGAGGRPPDARRTGARLLAVCVYTVAVALVLWGVDGIPTAVRIPIALPVLLFIPGYVLLEALFPAGTVRGGVTGGAEPDEGPEAHGALEQFVLSVVASIVVVPSVAFVANWVTGIRFVPILLGVTVVTVVAAVVAAVRSRTHASGAAPQSRDAAGSTGGGWRDSMTDTVTIVGVALTAFLLLSSAALALGGPQEEPRTEFYVAGSDVGEGSSGDALATVDLGVRQHGSNAETYTVVAMVRDGGSDAEAASWREIDRFEVVAPADEPAATSYRVPRSDVTEGDTVRFLLYRGDAPASPAASSAHRVLELTLGTQAD